MNPFYILIFILLLAGVGVGFLAAWAKRNNRVGVIKVILWGFVIFFGCFYFPLWSDYSPLKGLELAFFVLVYCEVGKAVFHFYKKEEWKKVGLLSVGMTLLGMVCRYFLEYGEVSNTYNFTPENIIFYAVMAPLLIMFNYLLQNKYSGKK